MTIFTYHTRVYTSIQYNYCVKCEGYIITTSKTKKLIELYECERDLFIMSFSER